MVTLKYGNVVTFVDSSEPLVHELVKNRLTLECDDGDPASFYNTENHTFLSGLLQLVRRDLSKKDFPHEVVDCPYPDLSIPKVPASILATSDNPDFLLHDFQVLAARKMLVRGRGILECGTGGGKTEIYIATLRMLEIILKRPIKSITLVGYLNLARQLSERMKKRGLKSVIMLESGGFDTDDCDHVVAVVNSVYSKLTKQDQKCKDLLSSVDVFTVDETQHLQSKMYRSCGFYCDARFRYGLSATPYSKKHDPYSNLSDMIMTGVTGPVIIDIPSKYLRSTVNPRTGAPFLPTPSVVFIPCNVPQKRYGFRDSFTHRWVDTSDWQIVQRDCITENDYRNELIRRLVYWTVHNNSAARICILIGRLAHGNLLQDQLLKLGINSVCSFGGDYVRAATLNAVEEYDDPEGQVLTDFETGKYQVLIASQKFDEGQDLPVVTDLILAIGGRGGDASRRLCQRIGRALHSKSDSIRIFDFQDTTHYMTRAQSKVRLRLFESEGYEVDITHPLECNTPLPG